MRKEKEAQEEADRLAAAIAADKEEAEAKKRAYAEEQERLRLEREAEAEAARLAVRPPRSPLSPPTLPRCHCPSNISPGPHLPYGRLCQSLRARPSSSVKRGERRGGKGVSWSKSVSRSSSTPRAEIRCGTVTMEVGWGRWFGRIDL